MVAVDMPEFNPQPHLTAGVSVVLSGCHPGVRWGGELLDHLPAARGDQGRGHAGGSCPRRLEDSACGGRRTARWLLGRRSARRH